LDILLGISYANSPEQLDLHLCKACKNANDEEARIESPPACFLERNEREHWHTKARDT
jgi:hypothetical protein